MVVFWRKNRFEDFHLRFAALEFKMFYDDGTFERSPEFSQLLVNPKKLIPCGPKTFLRENQFSRMASRVLQDRKVF